MPRMKTRGPKIRAPKRATRKATASICEISLVLPMRASRFCEIVGGDDSAEIILVGRMERGRIGIYAGPNLLASKREELVLGERVAIRVRLSVLLGLAA
jgi:hypothetical protein